MSPEARMGYTGACYHVINRGNCYRNRHRKLSNPLMYKGSITILIAVAIEK